VGQKGSLIASLFAAVIALFSADVFRENTKLFKGLPGLRAENRD
jgi:hypothetical protein